MKVRALAWNTFATLMRNKLILLFLAGFLCVVLLMMTPMLALRSYKGSPETAAVMVMGTVSVIMAMLTGFGSLLAAWSATAVVAAELNSGTILAVMARPIRRWEYLLGKYLGVQMLMWIYIVFILAMTYLLSWLGGARVQAGMWVLIVYPMVRYALYSALAMALAAILHPILAFGGVLLASVLAGMAGPGSSHHTFPEWLRQFLYVVLPSTGLLSESNFLSITETKLKHLPWSDHLLTVSYGLDYALVCFLLAVWAFRRRPLTRD